MQDEYKTLVTYHAIKTAINDDSIYPHRRQISTICVGNDVAEKKYYGVIHSGPQNNTIAQSITYSHEIASTHVKFCINLVAILSHRYLDTKRLDVHCRSPQLI